MPSISKYPLQTISIIDFLNIFDNKIFQVLLDTKSLKYTRYRSINFSSQQFDCRIHKSTFHPTIYMEGFVKNSVIIDNLIIDEYDTFVFPIIEYGITMLDVNFIFTSNDTIVELNKLKLTQNYVKCNHHLRVDFQPILDKFHDIETNEFRNNMAIYRGLEMHKTELDDTKIFDDDDIEPTISETVHNPNDIKNSLIYPIWADFLLKQETNNLL